MDYSLIVKIARVSLGARARLRTLNTGARSLQAGRED
jgi:hypothetical protein